LLPQLRHSGAIGRTAGPDHGRVEP